MSKSSGISFVPLWNSRISKIMCFDLKLLNFVRQLKNFPLSWAMTLAKNLWRFLVIPGIGNLYLMLSVFLLPSLVVWLKDIWQISVQLFWGWLTNAHLEWPTICRKTLAWPYALWKNFCFALELLLVEVPTSSTAVSRIRSQLHYWVAEGNLLQGR